MSISTKRLLVFLILSSFVLLGLGSLVLSHESHNIVEENKDKQDAQNEMEIFKFINEEYRKEIKPIFQNSCFNCHSSQTQYPWYHSVPGIKGIIDSDIQEARKHLDFSNDFPFVGHGSPREDLEAIQKVVKEKSMPPLRYRMLHWGSGLSEEEKEKIIKWVQDSQQKLNANQ